MPGELDVTTEGLPSSEQTALDAPVQPDAESSPAHDVEPKDTLSIVRDVVGADEEPEAKDSSPESEATAPAADAEEPKQPDNEDYSDVPFGKHPRFQHLLREAKANRADAERYRNVERFLTDNGLSAEHAAEALRVRALMNTNPAEAWKILRPLAEQAAIAAGAILPPDLQQRVQAGQLSREAALELSQARAGQQSLERQREWEVQRQQQYQAEQAEAARRSTVEQWKAERAMRDPNFAAKEKAIQKELFFLTGTRGEPRNPAEIVALLNEAYQNANAAVPAQPPAPRPKPAVKPVTGGQGAGTSRAEPTNTLDIIRARLGRG